MSLLTPLASAAPFVFFCVAVLAACGKKRPPPKAADKGKKPGSKSGKALKSKSGKSLKSKRDPSSKKLSKSGKSSKGSKKSSASKKSIRDKPGVKPLVGPVGVSAKPIPGVPVRDISLKSTQTLSMQSIQENKKLEVQPVDLRWAPTGGLQSVTVVNNTGERQALKVKCSDNALYRVSPVHAFVESGQRLKVDVLRQVGAPKVDRLVLLTANAKPTDASAKTCFQAGGQHPTMVVPMFATSAAA
ncbi:MSP-domain protein 5 [Aphelenchoides avenae]|nr:MSP-domain protein 5 [Aphelenchus avenae]